MADDKLDFQEDDALEQAAVELDFQPVEFEEDIQEAPGALATFGRSAAQTATLNFGDELAGLLDAASPVAMMSDKPFSETYREGKEEFLSNLQKGREENPVAGYAGMAAGLAPTLFIPGAGTAAGIAAMSGGAALGDTDFSKDSVSDVAKDVAIGTGLGFVGGKVLGRGIVPTTTAIGGMIQAPEALEQASEGEYLESAKTLGKGLGAGYVTGKAVKGLGSAVADTRVFELAKKRFSQGLQGLKKFGKKASEEVEKAQLAADEAQKVAETARQSYTKEAAQNLDITAEKSFRVLDGARSEIGEQIGGFWDDLYKTNPSLKEVKINPNRAVTNEAGDVVEQGLFDKIKGYAKGTPEVPNPSAEVMTKLSTVVAEVSPQGKIVPKSEITLEQLRALRKGIQNAFKNKSLAGETKGQLSDLYAQVNSELVEALTNAGLTDEVAMLLDLNNNFRTAVKLQGTIGKPLAGARTIADETLPGGRFTKLSKDVGKETTGATERAVQEQAGVLGPKYEEALTQLKEASKKVAGAKEVQLPETLAAEAAKGKAQQLAEDVITPPRGMPGSLWEAKHSAIKAIPEYGSNIAGLAVKSAKDAVTALPKALYESSPEAIKSVADKVLQSQGGRELGELLTKAAMSPDNIRRNAILFMLMQNPDYRKELGQHLGVGKEEE